jgi:hypothetical protein
VISPLRIVVFVKGSRQSTRGASFRYTVDKPAALTIYIQRRLTGRVKGTGCVAATKQNRKAKPCARYLTVTALNVKSTRAGAGQLKYPALAGKHPLSAGTYRVVAGATNSGGWSRAKVLTFTVVRRQVKQLPRPS